MLIYHSLKIQNIFNLNHLKCQRKLQEEELYMHLEIQFKQKLQNLLIKDEGKSFCRNFNGNFEFQKPVFIS